MKGYQHPKYAMSFREIGIPIKLPNSKGFILKRNIPDFPYYDGMGCYPFFVCQDWEKLPQDINELKDKLICIYLVTDPFGNYNEEILRYCFPDVMYLFKKHYVIYLDQPKEKYICYHHRRYARKALKCIKVEECERPLDFLEDWVRLYNNLVKRHNIKGITKFSKKTFQYQLEVPGIIAFRALYKNQTVGMLLWYIQNEVGYYHLGAFSDIGYEKRASFALFWYAIDYFSYKKLKWLNLGGGAGIDSNGSEGLKRFKKGWSNDSRNTYFCGRIFDYKKYYDIIKKKNILDNHFFPLYRKGEFE